MKKCCFIAALFAGEHRRRSIHRAYREKLQAIAKVGESHVGATAPVAREVGNNGTAGDRGSRPYRQIQKNSVEKSRTTIPDCPHYSKVF